MKHTRLALLLVCSTCTASDKPLRIHWGKTIPDSTLLEKHYRYWESHLPFDGIIVPINQKRYSEPCCCGNVCCNQVAYR